MLYALDQNKSKIRAAPNIVARCPLCDEPLIPKCGAIKIWHFAHQPTTTCDPWYEPESPWHLGWKSLVKPEFSEVLIRSKGSCHIADIKVGTRILEFQKSPLSYIDRLKREAFYGPSLIWVVHQNRSALNIKYKSDGYCTFRWKHPKEWIITLQMLFPFYLDFDDGQMLLVRGVRKYPYFGERTVYFDNITDEFQEGYEKHYRTGGWGQVISKDKFIEEYLTGYLNG